MAGTKKERVRSLRSAIAKADPNEPETGNWLAGMPQAWKKEQLRHIITSTANNIGKHVPALPRPSLAADLLLTQTLARQHV